MMRVVATPCRRLIALIWIIFICGPVVTSAASSGQEPNPEGRRSTTGRDLPGNARDPIGPAEGSATSPGSDAAMPYSRHFTLYAGPYSPDGIDKVATFQADYNQDTYVAVAAAAWEFVRFRDMIGFEIEGQVARHFGAREDHWELVGLIVGRWHRFPWENRVRTTFAVGEGISWYTEESELERELADDAGRVLNYLMFELTLGLPRYERWDLSIRIHHRSNVFGLMEGSRSNFLCAGIRYAF